MTTLLMVSGMCSAYAEEARAVSVDWGRLDFSAVQEVVDGTDAGFEISDLLRSVSDGEGLSDPDAVISFVEERAIRLFRTILPDLAGVVVPVLIWALVKQLSGGRGGGKYLDFACGTFCALTLLRVFAGAFRLASGATRQLMVLTDALVPVLVSMLVFTGGTHSAALITPMGALVSRFLALGVQKSALSLTAVAAGLSAADAMGGLKLKRLSAFVRAAAKWILKTAVGAYLALMATGGLISGAYDGAVLRGAKYAADNLLPIVGGEVAGMMDSLAASVTLLRSGAGLTGAAALMAVCMTPVIHCGCLALMCGFFSAIAEPVANERALRLLDAFSGVFRLLMAVVASAAALILVLIGAAMGMGQRIAG